MTYLPVADGIDLANPNSSLHLGNNIVGDIWPEEHIQSDGKILLKKLFTNRKYTELSGITFLFVTDHSLAEEYFLYQKQLDSNSILISVTDDIDIKDADGYDFGNPEGGYSVIESVILVQNNEVLKKEYLNKYFLFKDMDKLKKFLRLIKNADDVEELDCYLPVAIKRVAI